MKGFLIILLSCFFMVGCAKDNSSMYQETAEQSAVLELYGEICGELEAGSSQIEFYGVDEDSVVQAYLSVIGQHPEFFWLGNGYFYEVSENGDQKKVTLIPEMSEELRKNKEQFDALVEKIVRETATEENLFQQVRFIHDYLVENTVYDQDTYEVVSKTTAHDKIYPATTAYGCLVEGKAVCSGYAAAFQLLANRLGYECGRVTGSKISGESHEWNYIKLDDEYYYIDVTWDDPITEENRDIKTYNYFCITSDELERSHRISKGQNIPDCNGTKFNYHRYFGLYFEEYKQELFLNLLTDSADSYVEVRFSTPNECNKAVQELFNKNKIFDMVDVSSVSYSVDEMAGILRVEFE